MVYNLLITAAVSWYFAFAITSSEGPFSIFLRLREWRDGRWHGRNGYMTDSGVKLPVLNINGKDVPVIPQADSPVYLNRNGLLDCIICLIFWLALATGYLQGLTVLESIAAAGVGLWLHSYTGWIHRQ